MSDHALDFTYYADPKTAGSCDVCGETSCRSKGEILPSFQGSAVPWAVGERCARAIAAALPKRQKVA